MISSKKKLIIIRFKNKNKNLKHKKECQENKLFKMAVLEFVDNYRIQIILYILIEIIFLNA